MAVEVRNLSKSFGAARVVDSLSFTVPRGKILTLLGPSGCGKTTTLRCIAGLEKPDDGEISIEGDPVTSVPRGIMLPPDKRGLGMVFQSYAIWPHMTVFANVAFPLKVRGVPSAEVTRRVDETLELVGLAGFAERNATKLSGGQQQRVALARALAGKPRLLLFDEPLSNLDAKLRERMRFELVRLQKEIGITSIYVTHDQAEAMAISDEMIVMNHGRIEQRGDPNTVYFNPTTRFVADFIGVANFLPAEVVSAPDGSNVGRVRLLDLPGGEPLAARFSSKALGQSRVVVSIRPEAAQISTTRPEGGNVIPARLVHAQFLGDYVDARVAVGGREARVRLNYRVRVNVGDEVYLQIPPNDCLVVADSVGSAVDEPGEDIAAAH
ncbi:MAG: ABC transporter ATP-binding protein [Chloroflexi bacterium]|nr:ABC transporter ATP-binding protein [Chloroflexota bacterium]